jgi:hypothetical protein
LVLGVQNTAEVFKEVFAMVELVPELSIAKRETAAKLCFFHPERTDSIGLGARSERGTCGCNSLLNCATVNCEFGS